MPGVLVLGYDDSDGAQAALGVAIDLARETGDSLVVTYAYEPPYRMIGDEAAAHRQSLKETGEHATRDAVARARNEGVETEAVLVAERPVDALLSVAAERDARLIVVGTYSESPLRGAILGATPHKLLHLSDRPVLVVPATPGASED